MHLYVYYRVAAADTASLIGRVHAMQATIAAETSIAVGLQRKVDEVSTDGTQTWMEIYPDVAPDFEARLAAAVVASGLDACTGPRRVERFEDLTCA